MSRALGVGGIPNVLPLPGMSEMTSIVKDIIKLANGYKKDECESLARRFDSLIAVADTSKELESVSELLSQLQELKSRFEKTVKHKSKLPEIFRAQEKLQACDSLSRELTEILESFQLQHSISVSRRWIEEGPPTSRSWIDDNARFSTIDAHQLCYDEQQFSELTSQPSILIHETGAIDNRLGPVAATSLFGSIGTLRVRYTSFSSQSDHDPIEKTKVAEERLKQLSRITHKNIAVVVGVTKGCDGLNGFVSYGMGRSLKGVPIKAFFGALVPCSALARCQLRGLQEAERFIGKTRYGYAMDHDGNDVTMSADCTYWATDPVVRKALCIYRPVRCGWDGCVEDRQRSFTEALMSYGRSYLTERRLLKILADCQFPPLSTTHDWSGDVLPRFMICAGDLGCISGTEGVASEEWETMEECSEADFEPDPRRDRDEKYWVFRGCCCKWQNLPSTRPQYQTWVTNCQHKSIYVPQRGSESKLSWNDVMKRAKTLSARQKIELEHISYVSSMFVWIGAKRPDLQEQPAPESRVYFHHNPLDRSRPCDFWGFFSASPDPYAPLAGLERSGWTFSYHMRYETLRIGEDYGIEYQRALQADLASMPGGYPGAYTEEISDEEPE
ncbi:hypothetical protein BDV93DRAFT_557849 [Ceratobasidium sp. AG-I]|nr:hypothetical protein BDV93DRAFT_557849 [Ceratobasidium sp. AG-I]